MNKVGVYKAETGQLYILNPAPRFVEAMTKAGMDEATIMLTITERDVPAAQRAGVVWMDKSAAYSQVLGGKRVFRDAWDLAGKVVVTDMPKARVIKLGLIRVERDAKLKELDLEYMLADEADNVSEKASVAARKQALRDLPTTVNLDTLTTPAELENFVPVELA